MSVPRFARTRGAETGSPDRGWVGEAYGSRAQSLVAGMLNHLRAAERESATERTSAFDPVDAGHDRARTRLEADLTELRALVLETEVPPEFHDHDLRLRASLSTAIGAASSLALASPSQPTRAYLKVTQDAVEALLAAAGSASSRPGSRTRR